MPLLTISLIVSVPWPSVSHGDVQGALEGSYQL
jgi:hypothetical protein